MLTQEEILSATPKQARELLADMAAKLPLLIAQASRAEAPPEHLADELLDAKEAGPRLKMHPQTLRQWAECPFLIIRGRRKLYSLTGMERWIAERTR